jgi:DNA helicase-2/ATP-dependent DNA helicase PcrA
MPFVNSYGDSREGRRSSYADHGYRARSAQEQLVAARTRPGGRGLRGGVGNRPIPELSVGDRVTHDAWGMGRVVDTRGAGEGVQAQIDFGGDVGVKWLMLRYAPLQKL